MRLVSGTRSQLQARIDERGVTWEQIQPAIISESGDEVTVDVEHAAYPRPRVSRGKPGDLLAAIIHRIGFAPSAGCGCEAMRKQMNEWGWWGCWRHREELVDWFVSKAAEAGVEVRRASVFGLLRAALHEAWRDGRSH